MIDLCQWRARIGTWNCCQLSESRDSATGSIYSDYCKTKGEGRPCLIFSILSIFILIALLLFISGNVELNPGPTLTDQPTKEELVELLSSSKFTSGNWEHFICYLPNMAQDIVVGIKQSVEENEASPSNYIDAVAQHCHNIPDITWRNICIALLSSNEVNLAQNILDKHS
ncbi:PREDICTED: uncharacterized protein LOC109590239, partial [Amphimedon queenslandica]|uniref:Death domain-containing protein n=2 Tax=Amphimedon queenslandica TaxID=400682 RepID=A0AAN0JXS2_AMPQE